MHYCESKDAQIIDVEFKKDDLIVFHGGIHSFSFNEKTVLLEVKNGPYYGHTADKEVL